MLLYRKDAEGLKVLLVHPSGAYNKKAPWSIPKGEPNNAAEDHAGCAIRETFEEIGIQCKDSDMIPLGSCRYKSGSKTVYCFGQETTQQAFVSSWEIDAALWFSPEEAKLKIHKDQAVFVDRLLDYGVYK